METDLHTDPVKGEVSEAVEILILEEVGTSFGYQDYFRIPEGILERVVLAQRLSRHTWVPQELFTPPIFGVVFEPNGRRGLQCLQPQIAAEIGRIRRSTKSAQEWFIALMVERENRWRRWWATNPSEEEEFQSGLPSLDPVWSSTGERLDELSAVECISDILVKFDQDGAHPHRLRSYYGWKRSHDNNRRMEKVCSIEQAFKDHKLDLK